MKNINIFCFGFGQVAKNFIKKINLENFNISLSTTSRNETEKKKFGKINYTSFKFDGDSFDPKINERIQKSQYILISIPPRDGTDLVFKTFSKVIENSKVKWVTYLSATSVYGDHKGNWVSENSNTKPTSANGLSRLHAERLWMSFYLKKNLPLQIFRLSGIYSNENNVLERLKFGKVKIINKKNHFFSRVHVEDISNILFKSLTKFKPGEIYNISDDKPTPSQDVTLYGVKLLNIAKPNSIKVKDIENEMLKNFYKDSKKVSNKKMKDFFNYSLVYPSYIEGLNYISNNQV